MLLVGRVASGQGDLAQWIRRYMAAYARATGMTLHPGSLNLVLDDPWSLPRLCLRLSPADVGVAASLVPCRFQNTPAFIFRTDRAEAANVEERRILEILSPLHLRSTFGLSDGDRAEVEIEID